MSNAVVRRPEKPVSIESSKAKRAGILKFDRRAGVIVLETDRRASKPRALNGLVRNLL